MILIHVADLLPIRIMVIIVAVSNIKKTNY